MTCNTGQKIYLLETVWLVIIFGHSLMGTVDDKRFLAQMGYTQELYRGFGGFMSFAFCFTEVSVIPSISLGFSTGVSIGGPAEIVWSWVIGSFFCIIAGMSMAEISSVYPSAGSVYHWAGHLAPPEWAPISSYICGWFNFLGNAAGDASFSNGLTSTIAMALAIGNPDADPLSTGAQVGISILVLATWSLLDCARTDVQGWINNFAVFWQIAGSFIIVICLLTLSDSRATATDVLLEGYDLTNVTLSQDAPYLGMRVSPYTIVLGITNCLFAFTGSAATSLWICFSLKSDAAAALLLQRSYAAPSPASSRIRPPQSG